MVDAGRGVELRFRRVPVLGADQRRSAALVNASVRLDGMGGGLELEVSQIQWVVISYVLTYASLLLATGRLSDAFGHRRVS